MPYIGWVFHSCTYLTLPLFSLYPSAGVPINEGLSATSSSMSSWLKGDPNVSHLFPGSNSCLKQNHTGTFWAPVWVIFANIPLAKYVTWSSLKSKYAKIHSKGTIVITWQKSWLKGGVKNQDPLSESLPWDINVKAHSYCMPPTQVLTTPASRYVS